jgi:hypothetical protein
MWAVALVVTLLQVASARRDCTGDKCLRAVTGDGLPATETRRADCSSFLSTTVVPATSTLYSTVTSITTTTLTLPATLTSPGSTTSPTTTLITTSSTTIPDQTISPSVVPIYAAACSDAIRYSSACSRWGISGSITTVPGATITSVSTFTSTSTLIVTPSPTVLTGAIRLSRVDNGLPFGYISRDLGDYLLSSTTTNPIEALVVSVPLIPSDVDFDLVNQQGTSPEFEVLGFYVPFTDGSLRPGQSLTYVSIMTQAWM